MAFGSCALEPVPNMTRNGAKGSLTILKLDTPVIESRLLYCLETRASCFHSRGDLGSGLGHMCKLRQHA